MDSHLFQSDEKIKKFNLCPIQITTSTFLLYWPALAGLLMKVNAAELLTKKDAFRSKRQRKSNKDLFTSYTKEA